MRGRGMGDAAAIADDIQPIIAAHQLFIDGNLHIIELYLYTIKEGIIICCAGRNLIECINHFDNAIQQAFGQNKTQITGVAFNVGVTKDSSIRFGVERRPRIKSPKRCTITPPPSILLRRAMDSP